MRPPLVIAMLTLFLLSMRVRAQTVDEWRWLSSLHMIDEQFGWAQSTEGGSGATSKGGIPSVVRTIDGGIHWKDVRPADTSGQKFVGAYLIQTLTSDVAWVSSGSASDPSHSGLFRTVDGGQTWKFMTANPIYSNQHFINPSDGWSYAISDQASYLAAPRGPVRIDVYRSTDGGATWSKIGIADLSSLPNGFRRMTFQDSKTGWIAGFGGDEPNCCAPGSPCTPPARPCLNGVPQFVTRDGGHTWQRQILLLPPQFRSPHFWVHGGFPRFFSTQDGIVTVDYSNQDDAGVVLYITHDRGVSWASTVPHIWNTQRPEWCGWVPGYADSSFADIDHVWVTDGCALHLTSDGGRTWRTVQPGPLFNGMTEINFISRQVGWATCPVLCKPTLLKTTDGGRTWKDLSFSISR